MRKKIFIYLILVVLISSVFIGCTNRGENEQAGELKPIKVMLDWVPNTNHTGLYIAQAKDWYKDQGLDVEIVQPQAGGTAQLVAAGQAQFGISYQEEVTYARANDMPVVSIAAIIQHNTSGFASPKFKKINSPKDFEGKKYGGFGSPIEKATIKSIMEKEGAEVKKVNFVNVDSADFFTATKGDVDFEWIYYGWTGIEAELKDYQINFIQLTEIAPQLDSYTPIIIVSEDYIKENPEIIKKFMEATTQGYEFAVNNPDEAADILLSRIPGMNEELVKASQKWLSSKYQDDAKQWGIQKQEVWYNYAQWMTEQELIPKMIDAEKAYTNEFLPKR